VPMIWCPSTFEAHPNKRVSDRKIGIMSLFIFINIY